VGRAGTGSVFDLHRWAPSPDAARFVEHFWSVRWDRRDDGPFESTVITFPAVHITREWGDDVGGWCRWMTNYSVRQYFSTTT
jgi:hypothetical protein